MLRNLLKNIVTEKKNLTFYIVNYRIQTLGTPMAKHGEAAYRAPVKSPNGNEFHSYCNSNRSSRTHNT